MRLVWSISRQIVRPIGVPSPPLTLFVGNGSLGWSRRFVDLCLHDPHVWVEHRSSHLQHALFGQVLGEYFTARNVANLG
jgi:hypothetical protein